MWEQRFYTDGRLAPCWGYQIDETASVIAGLYQHFKIKEFRLKERDIDFLKDNLIMCENAIEFLKNYIDNLLNDKGMEENLQTKYSYLDRSQIYKHVSYDLWEMNEGIHLYSLSAYIFPIASKDSNMDISIMGAVTPFRVYVLKVKLIFCTVF